MEKTADKNYQVLARKYRSRNFKELKGQDVLVQTLTNAIQRGKIAHAYMMTGVRGVGKTSSARIFAKALNCTGEKDEITSPTIEPCGICENCKSIENGNHIDVIEMDAASHTGVDDVRKIIEEVQYKPVVARYKIYIIDEVHMLSKSAFNALLKTLEEPPAHAKFIFATTEINKVPITILSRCQKFNLSRIEIPVLSELFTDILKKENVETDNESIEIIARASGGSARDGLSLLDQAISNSDGKLTVEKTKEILGVSDRESVLKIFNSITLGKPEEALEILSGLHKNGADTFMILSDLMEYTHNIIKVRIIPSFTNNLPMTDVEKTEITNLSKSLDVSKLINLWQIFTKGFDEMKSTDKNFQTLEMILIKASYITAQPSLEKLIENLENGNLQIEGQKKNIAPENTDSTGKFQEAPALAPIVKEEAPMPEQEDNKFKFKSKNPLKDIVQKLKDDKNFMLAMKIEDEFVFSKLDTESTPQKLEIGLKTNSSKLTFKSAQKVLEKDFDITLTYSAETTGKTLKDEGEDSKNDEITQAKKESPVVKEIFGAFGDLEVDKIEEK